MFATWKWSNHVIVNLQVNLGLKHVWLLVHHEAAWAGDICQKAEKANVLTSDSKKRKSPCSQLKMKLQNLKPHKLRFYLLLKLPTTYFNKYALTQHLLTWLDCCKIWWTVVGWDIWAGHLLGQLRMSFLMRPLSFHILQHGGKDIW